MLTGVSARIMTLSARASLQGLLPLYIHPQTGDATTQMVSMGAMGDSYYEYLLKVWIYKGRRKEDDMYRGESISPPRQPKSPRCSAEGHWLELLMQLSTYWACL